jgi:uncharacterized RDD family membrane protein YckC
MMNAISHTARAASATRWIFSPWWRRVVAEVIDVAIVAVIANVLLVIVGEHPWWIMDHAHAMSRDTVLNGMSFVLAGLLYYPALMRRTDGRTLGKMALGIQVVRTDGHAMSMVRAVWREIALKSVLLGLLGAVPLVGLIVSQVYFWADGLWPLWDRENRALHDMLARTRVTMLRNGEVPQAL